ncbi:hypothetical protein BSNK01_25570 [Bacillaceae bacterium]
MLKRPIVGVFVDHAIIRKLNKQNRNFRSYPRVIELAKASVEAAVTLYFFSIKNFDFKRIRIIGTFYENKSSKWKQKEFPLPDVLYFRRSNGGPNQYIVEHIKTIMEQNQVLKINAKSYFDKWEVYRDLSLVPRIKKYLPYTTLYERESDLTEFLETHDEAYLKGVRGGRGRWIFRVRKQPEGKFEYSYDIGQTVIGTASGWDDLFREIRKFYGNQTFMIQKGIDLIQIDDCKIDFRAELQRNGEGKTQYHRGVRKDRQKQIPHYHLLRCLPCRTIFARISYVFRS